MTAAYINSATIQSGGTFTAGAGTSRRVVAEGFVAKDTGTPTWSATYGGVAMTLDAQSAYVGDYKWVSFSLQEASIPSGSQTLVVSAASGTILTPFYGTIYTLGGRDQTTALDSGFTTSGNGTSSASFTTASVTNSTGSFLVAAIRLAPADSISSRPSGWVHDSTNSTSQAAHSEYKDDAAGATTTYTWGFPGDDYIYGLAAYKAASAGAYTLTCAQGSYALNGQTVGTLKTTIMALAQGAYALNGQDITLTRTTVGQTMPAAQGSFSLLGSDAMVDTTVVFAQGSFALTGQAINTLAGYVVAAVQGAYVLTGRDIGLIWSNAPIVNGTGCGFWRRRRR